MDCFKGLEMQVCVLFEGQALTELHQSALMGLWNFKTAYDGSHV